MKREPNSQILNPREVPDVSRMIEEIEADMSGCASYVERLKQSDETMEAWWPGQSDDGRKHDTTESEAYPFDGASDARIRVSEEVVNERVLIKTAATIGGRSLFKPKESGDAVNATLFTTLMNHFMSGPMKVEIRDELDFLAEWQEACGLSILFVGWHTERALEPKTITEEDLLQFAVNLGLQTSGLPSTEELGKGIESGEVDAEQIAQAEAVAEVTTDDLRDMLLDPKRTKELVRQIRQYDPEVTAAEALRVARALQADEAGDYFAPYVRESRPVWEALLPLQDVVFSGAVKNIQKAPRITRQHWLTETDLLDRAKMEGWDKAWLDLVLKNPGRALNFGMDSGAWVMSGSAVRWEFMSDEELVRAGYYQITEVYSRRSSLAGAPCIYRTILHGSVNNAYGLHEVCRYKHGGYPFVAFRRERKKRPMTSSRSIPELTVTNQQSIKEIHDSRRNRNDLAVSPPVIVAGRRSGGRIRIGPDMEIPEARAGTLRWMDPPRMDMDTVAIAQDERAQLDSYFGRWSKNVPQPLVQLHQQKIVNDWLVDIGAAVLMTAQLVQQYVTAEEATRIVGTEYTLDDSRRAIQAQWDLTISFDVRDLDLEWLAKKMKMVNEFVLAGDVLNVVDKAGMTEFLFAAIDPVMAQRLVQPRAKAQQSEMDDEDRALSTIFTGGEPELMQGLDHAGRAQRMMEKTQNSPTRMQLLQTNGEIKKVWDNRLKFHQTQVSQEKNKQIGRLGGSPVLGAALSEAGKIPA